jgi:hypothetical protein
MKAILFQLLCFCLIVAPSSHAADTNPPPRLTVELRDGSRVLGVSVEKSFKFHSALLGDFKLAVKDVCSVECVSSNTAKLVTVNGDSLTVLFADSEFALKTGFGKVDLAANSIRKITIAAAGATIPQRDGLVAFWSGDGNPNDSVGGNNGTLIGSAKFSPGKVGQGFLFNGRNGSDVSLGNPDSLQLQDFTIEAWIKRSDSSVTSYGSYGIGVIFGYGLGGYGLCLDASGCPALTKIGIDNTKPNVTITDTDFHHLAVTKSGSTVVFYVDGIAYPAPAYDPGFVFSTVAAIGARGDNLDNSFFGIIDEIAIYNRALSAAEIQATCTEQNGGEPLPPSSVHATGTMPFNGINRTFRTGGLP